MIKNFITKYVIKPKNERTATVNDVIMICAVMTLPFNIATTMMFKHATDIVTERERENTIDRCFVTGIIVNDDYSKTMLCQSYTRGTSDKPFKYVIHESELYNENKNIYLYKKLKLMNDGIIKSK